VKLRSLLILLIIALALIPVYYFNRWLQGVLQPKESAGRFFLFLFVNFLMIVVYTVLMVGVVVRVIPH
jgi:hypothetical protein